MDNRTRYWFLYMSMTKFDEYRIFKEYVTKAYRAQLAAIKDKIAQMEKRNKDKEDIVDAVDGEFWENESFGSYSTEMMVIANYRMCEMHLKSAIKYLYSSDLKKYYKWENIKECFMSNGIDLQLLQDYSVINELRCLNNCLKHSGYVDKNLLEANSIWVKNTKIENLDKHIERFDQATERFFRNLLEKIRTQLEIE